MSETQGKRNPLQVFFGCCLMVVGALIAVACGLCTVAVSGGMFGMGGGGPQGGGQNPLGAALVLFIFGGLPTLFGAAVFGFGVWLVRQRPPGVADEPPG